MNFHHIDIDLPFIFGGLESYLLVELIQKYKFYEKENALTIINNNKCFFYTYESIQQRLPFSRCQLDTIIKNLKMKKVIEVYKKGLPARNYFYLNFFILDSLRETYKLESNNLTNNKVEILQTYNYKNENLDNKSLIITDSVSLRDFNKVENQQSSISTINKVNKSLTAMQESDDDINNYLLNNKILSKEKEILKNKKEKNNFLPPTLEEVIEYVVNEKGYPNNLAKHIFEYYNVSNWIDSKGNKVKNWKQKCISVWLKEENKIKYKDIEVPKVETKKESLNPTGKRYFLNDLKQHQIEVLFSRPNARNILEDLYFIESWIDLSQLVDSIIPKNNFKYSEIWKQYEPTN